MLFKTALVTGASSGLGREFALALAKESKWNLILVARNEAALQQVKSDIEALWEMPPGGNSPRPMVMVMSVDLTAEKNRIHLMETIKSKDMAIDFLINNAGTGFGIAALGYFNQSDSSANERLLNLNCIAPMHLCRLVLPEMLEKKSGRIINLCSRRAFAPMPFLACYAASKAFLLHFSVALSQEVKGRGIRILAFCPTPSDTPGHQLNTAGMKSLFKPARPEQVVQYALQAIERNASVCVVGLMNKMVFGLLHFMPLALSARIQAFITHCTYKNRIG